MKPGYDRARNQMASAERQESADAAAWKRLRARCWWEAYFKSNLLGAEREAFADGELSAFDARFPVSE